MRKFLRILFYLIIILGALGLAYWLVYQKGWHWWLGIAIIFLVVGILFSIILFRRALTKRKMRDFVSRVVDQNNITSSIKSELTNRIEALRNKWFESADLIKMSKAQDIPWFMMLGGEDSGKSSAIKHAKLNIPISNRATNGNDQTDNCEWWFLEKSIILDTSGRYITPIDEVDDNEEWKELLHLFLKYRKRTPINGVIVSISAERLLNADHMSLNEEGQNIRKRIDNLMRIFWTKFPVYIMITKVDKIFGFNEAFQYLSKEEMNQAAGFLNIHNSTWNKVVDDFFSNLNYNLTKLREQILNKSTTITEPGLLMLPHEFAKIRDGFNEFIQPIFKSNLYQEQPLFRGIYISSAMQDLSTQSKILDFNDNYIDNVRANTATNGVFLRDFFDQILPSDRWQSKPAYNGLRIKYLTGSVGVISILSTSMAIASLMTASFLHNRNAINGFINQYSSFPIMTSDISSNIFTFYELQKAIHKLENSNDRWLLPVFGMHDSNIFADKAKDEYIRLYRVNFLNDFNNKLFNRIQQVNGTLDAQDTSMYIAFLTARIDSVNARLEHTATDKNSVPSDQTLQNVFPSIVASIYPQIAPSASSLVEETYISFISWTQNQEPMRHNMKIMLKMLRDLLIKNPVASVMNNQQMFMPYNIKLSDFWGDIDNNGTVIVPGMFTKTGLAQIKKFLALVKDAGVIQGEDDPMLEQFWQWYQSEYYSYWHKFIMTFEDVDLGSFSDDERKSIVVSMTTESNPYSMFLARAAVELTPEDHIEDQPDWAKLIVKINEFKQISSGESTIITIRQKVFDNIDKVVSNDRIEKKTADFNSEINNSNILKDYNYALSQITPDLISDDSYLKYMGDVFAEYNGKSEVKSPVSTAVIKFSQLRQALSKNSRGQNEMVWRLEAGPLNFMLDYLFDRTACAIDNKWSDNVLGKVSALRTNDMPKALLDTNSGLLWQFMGDTLSPFVVLNKWGYSSKTIFDKTYFAQSLSINSDFLNFANSNRSSMVDYQSQYAINLSTVPVAVNPDATVKPYGTVLTLQCADGEQTLKNYNYPNQATFNWNSDKCGDTTLSILFSNFTLTKTYSGSLGFAKFLADFKDGAHKFSNSDFAESNILNDDYKVNWIQVKYKINGNTPKVGMFEHFDTIVPQSITQCGVSHDRLDSFLQKNSAIGD